MYMNKEGIKQSARPILVITNMYLYILSKESEYKILRILRALQKRSIITNEDTIYG